MNWRFYDIKIQTSTIVVNPDDQSTSNRTVIMTITVFATTLESAIKEAHNGFQHLTNKKYKPHSYEILEAIKREND